MGVLTYLRRWTLQSLRLPVQDIYKIKDKRVVVGRVESGTLEVGNQIVFLPNNFKTTIKSVEVFMNENKNKAVAGESIGLTFNNQLFFDRGQIICIEKAMPKVTKKFKGNLFWMSNTSLKKGEAVKMKCATQESSCIVKEISKRMDSSTLQVVETNADELKNREVGEVVFESDKELVLDDFNKVPALGRFVIEKNLDTAGGGIIVNLDDDAFGGSGAV